MRVVRRKRGGAATRPSPPPAQQVAATPEPVAQSTTAEPGAMPLPPGISAVDVVGMIWRGRAAALLVCVGRDDRQRRFLLAGVWSWVKGDRWHLERGAKVRAGELPEFNRLCVLGAERISAELLRAVAATAEGAL